MRELICVYLDDKKDDLDRYGGWIKDAWERLGNGISLKLELASDPAKAIDAIQRPDVHLFVADLLFGPKKEPLGFHAISAARRKKPNLAILALSVGNGGTEQKARESGADDYLSKYYVLEEDVELRVLGQKLVAVLKARNIDVFGHDDITIQRDPGWQMAALVEQVTEKNIISLVRQIEPHSACKRLDLKFIRSGMSGAYVIGVVGNDCTSEVRPRLLLKVSRDGDAMNDELARRKGARWWPPGLLVPFVHDAVVSAGGWSAIAAHLIDGAETLSAALRGPNHTKATAALAGLFSEDNLLRVYRDTTETRTHRVDNALLSVLTPARRAKVEQALDDVEPIATRQAPLSNADAKLIHTALKGSLFDDKTRAEIKFWNSHGDLHARNIIYSRADSRPWLIDAGSITILPWPCDLARLCCDLIVDSLDAGPLSHEWGLLPTWLTLAGALIRGDVDTLANYPSPIVTCLMWLREQLGVISGLDADTTELQFRLALVVELLRATYRIDIGMPKRVLAYHAAAIAINAAAELS